MPNLDAAREELADAVSVYTPPEPDPIETTPWIAASLLQKSIRRGRADLTLRAAAALLRDDPARLWRRLAIIAVEDIGLGDPTTNGLVAAALAGKRIRKQLGGEWPVTSLIVDRLASAPKDRSADDLLTVVGRHEMLDDLRSALAERPTHDLIAHTTRPGPLVKRALAMTLVSKRGAAVVDALMVELAHHGLTDDLRAMAQRSYRQTRGPLGPLVALLSLEPGWANAPVVDDDMPPVGWIGDVPGWALDMFTREGRAAMARFLRTDAPTARWITTHVASLHRVEVMGNLVFTVEGGLMRQRLRWPLGDSLRRLAESNIGAACPDAREAVERMRGDVEVLNKLRMNP